TAEGPLDAAQAVVALGPFAPEVLSPLGITLPLGIKRGYHRHYRGAGNAALARPVVDMEIGYCLAPMDQGIRLTTGAEFAARDALRRGAVRPVTADPSIIRLTRVTRIFQKNVFTKATPAARAGCRAGLFVARTRAAAARRSRRASWVKSATNLRL